MGYLHIWYLYTLVSPKEFERGQKARDVKRSYAKYSVVTAVKVENIKTAFKVYELVQSSEKLSNYKIAKRVGSLEFHYLLGHYKHGQNC